MCVQCMYRSPGRIVETLLEDFTALTGGGLLTVIIQNTGSISADYSVRILQVYTHVYVQLHLQKQLYGTTCISGQPL